MMTRNGLLLCLAMLAFSCHLKAESTAKCLPDQEGSYATLALLVKKPEISNADFYAYWRDIHGVLAARIPGFWTYRQSHLGSEVHSLRHLPESRTGFQNIHGFADVSFCSAEDIQGLAGSAVAELIKHDEQNLFAGSYLYSAHPGDSLTLKTQQQRVQEGKTAPDIRSRFLMLLASNASLEEFKQAVMDSLDFLQHSCDQLWRLRVNFFQPYDANAWPAPNVNHNPDIVMNASVELLLGKETEAVSCLHQHRDHLAAVSPELASTLWQKVYRIESQYDMVVGGRPSLIGLRGLPAVELIERIGAENQSSRELLQVVYGEGND